MANAAGETRGLSVVTQTHQQAVQASTRDAARLVLETLGGTLAAYVLGVKDRKTVQRWASGAVLGLRPESEARLRGVHEIIALLARFEAPETIRAWFLGMAPELEDVAPAYAIHDGRLPEAMNAARAFIARG
ncbi:MAG TPA: XRE family transcriptional regulator [Chloroflexota bacterium]|nr:XRE family transcriptional regulator [Chloroflexota bacterium]